MVMGATTLFLKLTVLIIFYTQSISSLCEVETAEPVIILDIPESDLNKTDQQTIPAILPIRGELSQIRLLIIADSERIFKLDGKQLKLLEPLDRDARDIYFIHVQIQCTIIATHAQRTIPITVRVIDLNDNAPRFLNLPYETSVSELAPIGTTIFRGLRAIDDDSSLNSLVEYFVVPGNDSQWDGYTSFAIDLPYQGYVTLRQNLDYEKINSYEVTIKAVDRATKYYKRRSSTATLTIHVIDEDDQDPTFIYDGCAVVKETCVSPEYFAEIVSGKVSGLLKVNPNNIIARDPDKRNQSIIYLFVESKPPGYLDHFKIDSTTGVLQQVKAIDRSHIKKLSLIVKAEEDSERKRFSTAQLNIVIKASNDNPPVLDANSLVGYVDENSIIGTPVTVEKGNKTKLQFTVSDVDYAPDDPKPNYEFVLTTNVFQIDNNGFLLVADENLDGDRPNPDKYAFQVIAREGFSGKSSAPLAIVVHVNDVNDNSPEIDQLTPITVKPSEDPTVLMQFQGKDKDNNGKARILYSLHHVSNDGFDKFRVNKSSGALESLGPLKPGEQYSLTVQASDEGGRTTHRVLDVYVAPTTGQVARPSFSRPVYEVTASEGIAVGSVILSFNSDSSEDISYSIVDGNQKRNFMLSPLTGQLKIRQSLDRETSDRHILTIQAADRLGQTVNATVNVEVTDINDCNPEFVDLPYLFHVDEGISNYVVGRIKAVDEDVGPNGMVYYSVPTGSRIGIDPFTGELRTLTALDFERQAIEYVTVTARDGAADPRIATATVTIMVRDVPDEMPFFPIRYYDGSVAENMPNVDIVQVSAIDPDTYKQITYVIKDGATNRFAVDPISGIVRTIWPLNFEDQNHYVLIVGTRENFHSRPDSTCFVRITVLDRNDIPPLFTSLPPPLRLQDSVSVPSAVATVVAIDSDGTPPNNLVKYALTTSSRYQSYFDVDHDTGVITLKGDLSKETSNELKLEVQAYDLGSPQLTASTTLTIYIDHTMAPMPEKSIAFPDSSYTVEVEENAMGNIIVKTLPVINKEPNSGLFTCEIEKGNELDHFYTTISDDKNCELRTKGQKLDYETRPQYHLLIRLKSALFYADSRTTSEVYVNVKDTNDNRPLFTYRSQIHKIIGERYVFNLARDVHALATFAKVSAVDQDSGPFGQIQYSIIAETDPGGYFIIDSDTGLVSNSRTFDSVSANVSMFKLKVMARDNPRSESNSLNSTSTFVVNLISDEHRVIFVILDATPEKVVGQKEKIIEILQENTDFAINIEKIEPRKYINSSKLVTDGSATDVWINAIDPKTLQAFQVRRERVSKYILREPQQRSLLYIMSSLLEMNVDMVRLPFVMSQTQPTLSPARIRNDQEMDGFQAALIALACIIAILGTVGIIYICFIWSKFSAYCDQLQKISLTPRYEPVLLEPHLKPYETQVLQMNVHMDDSSSSEGNSSRFEYKGHLDNISYITKGTNGDCSTLVLGNASFTESDSFEGGESVLLAPRRHEIRNRGNYGHLSPAHNPVYHSSDENASSPFEGYAIINKGYKPRVSLSPVAATTEL